LVAPTGIEPVFPP